MFSRQALTDTSTWAVGFPKVCCCQAIYPSRLSRSLLPTKLHYSLFSHHPSSSLAWAVRFKRSTPKPNHTSFYLSQYVLQFDEILENISLVLWGVQKITLTLTSRKPNKFILFFSVFVYWAVNSICYLHFTWKPFKRLL